MVQCPATAKAQTGSSLVRTVKISIATAVSEQLVILSMVECFAIIQLFLDRLKMEMLLGNVVRMELWHVMGKVRMGLLLVQMVSIIIVTVHLEPLARQPRMELFTAGK
jgi:hypothetical protein